MADEAVARWAALVAFLGEVLGPDYEIALHDLSDPAAPVVAISHGELSGRSVGSPLDDKSREVLAERRAAGSRYAVNYSGVSRDGAPLRSSMILLEAEAGAPAGLLRIDFDDTRFADIAAQVLRLCHPDEFVERTVATIRLSGDEATDALPNSVASVADAVIAELVAKYGVPVDRLTQEEKIEVIEALHRKGVFLMKGAVGYVAKVLASSEASVYRYLSKLTKARS